jgi:AcrR family transcriptional regulator
LIEVALEVFGREGYHAVRTRALADAARANQAAIPYHFGGKEGLYLAVAEDLAETMGSRLRTVTDRVDTVLSTPDTSASDLQQMLHELLVQFTREAVGIPATAARAQFIVREQLAPGPAFEILYERIFRPLHCVLTALITRIRDLPEESEEAVLEAHALLGEAIGFTVAREAALRRLGWSELTPERTERIAQMVAAHGRLCTDTRTID